LVGHLSNWGINLNTSIGDDNVDFAEFVIRSLGSGAQGIKVTRIGFKRNEAPIFLFDEAPSFT
jgi:hypothetical protein